MFLPAPSKNNAGKFLSFIFSFTVDSFKMFIQPEKNTAEIKKRQIVKIIEIMPDCVIKTCGATRFTAIKYITKNKVIAGFSLTAANDFLIKPENITKFLCLLMRYDYYDLHFF